VGRWTGAAAGASLVTLLLALASRAPGAPLRAGPAGPEVRISGASATGDDLWPAVGWNGGADDYLVVWEDRRNGASRGSDVFGRRVSAVGSVVGTDFRISGARATSDERHPAVVWNPGEGEYLVVWSDRRNFPARGWDVFGRRVSGSGVALGTDFRISGPRATSDDLYPAVAWNSAEGEYLVVWEDQRNVDARGRDVFGRRVSAEGSVLGKDFRISGARATAHDRHPAVAWNGTEYLVVWHDGRNMAARSWDVFGRRVSAAGVPVGPDFRISGPGATAGEWVPSVAWSGTEYLVVWEDARNLEARSYDVFGRRVSGSGVPLGGDFRISGPGATAGDFYPAVAWNGAAGEYLVVWGDGREASTRGWDVFGRVVSASGSPAGADFRICGPGADAGDAYAEVACSASGCLVAWHDERNEAARGWDIFGRRVSG
jgi:hypothetical protein